ncbi:MAG: mannitol dehydrogenase family protein [Pararhizobium sp.]
MPPRLSARAELPDGIRRPAYDRTVLRTGIVHLGLGAFHRAHQAVYTDAALGRDFGPWGIEAVSLRSAATADALSAQDGLFSVLTRAGDESEVQVVGALLAAHAARERPALVLDRLADPAVRIVTLTVTEKAYGLDPKTGGLDLSHADIAADRAAPEMPRGVLGHLVEGLARRRAAGTAPFTVLCCDNLPANGHVVARLTTEFARLRDTALADWIAENVTFPSSMVDRIVPAPTERTFADVEAVLKLRDEAAVETEPFMQWVVEDRFPGGRPAWEAGGALFVSDVEPYEHMKLRLLNGAHSLIAYLGQNRGLAYVRDVMAVEPHRRLVEAHMRAAAETLRPVPGIDIEAYIASLLERFSNTAIAHATAQIATDGTQKLPQRLLLPTVDALSNGYDGHAFARAVAEWIVYCCRRDSINDPRERELLDAAAQARAAGGAGRAAAFLDLPGLFPDRLRSNSHWRRRLDADVDTLWSALA